MWGGGQTTKSQMIITCQGFTIVLCETLRVSLPPLSGLGFQILQSAKVCEGTLQIVGGMLGNPAKAQPPKFMTFPTNSGLTLMSKWVPIYHHRRPSGKWPFFMFCNFFATIIMGKEWSSCFTWSASTSRRLRSAFLSRCEIQGDPMCFVRAFGTCWL